MKWSTFQSAIFDFVEHENGNAVIEAVAGSGKTTTLVEAIKRASGSAIFLAFNKSIAEELKARGVNARTFHSLTFGAVLRHKNASTVTADKLRKLVTQHFTDRENFLYGQFVCRLVGLGKQMGIGCLQPNIQSSWFDIISHHDLELEKDEADLGTAMELAAKLLDFSNRSNLVDFDDMLYVPVLDGLSLPKFDFVFVDEAQDTNAIQRALLRKIMKPNSRLIAVADPAQAIYGFRGADSDSVDLIAEEFNCKRFPLSVSYRCAKAIVEHARKWVDHIEACDTAEKGNVLDLGEDWKITDLKSTDFVVCRTTRPLLTLAFKMLRQRIPVTIMGRDIGKGLINLIRGFKTNDLDKLEAKVKLWSNREMEKAIATQNESKAASIEDKAECILSLIEEIQDEDESDVNKLISILDKLFEPCSNITTLATIHKSKGLEADKVFWLNSSECPSRWAKQAWQKLQEDNLCYVATTRAKKELVLIELES